MTTFLDTNVVIALLDTSNTHHAWSVSEVMRRKAEGPAIISDIVYCEVSVGMKDQVEVDAAIASLGLERMPESDAVLFRAGKAFKHYRDVNKGTKLGVMPDFLIGAMAEVASAPLLTANPKDFVGYFPDVEIKRPPIKADIDMMMPGVNVTAEAAPPAEEGG